MLRIVQHWSRICARVRDHHDKTFASLAKNSPWIAAQMKTTARWNGWLVAYGLSPLAFFIALDSLSSHGDLWVVLPSVAMGIACFKFGRWWRCWGKTPIKKTPDCGGNGE